MIALVCTLPDLLEALIRLPHHLVILYALGLVALLLIAVPVTRSSILVSRSRQNDLAEGTGSSILGLTPPDAPAPEPEPLVLRPVLVTSNVTPIHEKVTVTCTHCGINMVSHKDFCPACGYAQPMRQSFTA